MIFDSIACLSRYSSIIPNYEILSSYLSNNDITQLQPGKHNILNEDLFIIINEYETDSKENLIWESHDKYIDIHLVLFGKEEIGYTDTHSLVIKEPYNSDKDVTIFNKNADGQFLTLSPGLFCVFFPKECHKPSCMNVNKQKIKKAVIKIKFKEE